MEQLLRNEKDYQVLSTKTRKTIFIVIHSQTVTVKKNTNTKHVYYTVIHLSTIVTNACSYSVKERISIALTQRKQNLTVFNSINFFVNLCYLIKTL